MKLSEFKTALKDLNSLTLQLPNGEQVPAHFHLTELGHITKKFVDCGGKMREDHSIRLQLWYSVDYDHRLSPLKLLSIVKQSEDALALEDWPLEVEYQGDTIQKFGLERSGDVLTLTSTQTECLAEDQCGITPGKVVRAVKAQAAACCDPGSGCC